MTLYVEIQIVADGGVWYPKEIKKEETLINLYKSGIHPDIEFIIGTKSFRAHKIVLFQRCRELYELVSIDDNEELSGVTQLHIKKITAHNFNSILKFVYTLNGTQFIFSNLDNAKYYLTAADRFGVTDLKLLVESIITDKFLNPENAADLLLFADSNSCALLKEACMDLFVSDTERLENSIDWKDVENSNLLLKEINKHLLLKYRNAGSNDDEVIDRMNVTTLRKYLEEANLDVDGTRGTLVDRLKKILFGKLKRDVLWIRHTLLLYTVRSNLRFGGLRIRRVNDTS